MKPKLLIIVGPTASGKTSLSIKIAKQFKGEVISADSRQVYRGLDIGSGKVTKAEMEDVPHHLLDIVEPTTVYTAKDFVIDAEQAVTEISNRDKLPIIAGGTFFYIDALLKKASLPEVEPDEELRSLLLKKTAEELFTELKGLDSERAETIDPHNSRRLVRAIEIASALGKVPKHSPTDSPYDTLTFGIQISKEELHKNIKIRLEERLKEGMIEEVETLLKKGVSHERLEDLGLEYRYLSLYLRGEMDYETATTELETKIRQFAKRQLTWLKRDQSIIWIDPKDTENIFSTVNEWLQD